MAAERRLCTMYDVRCTKSTIIKGGSKIFLCGGENTAAPMGRLSASPFPSDQEESFSLSPLDPSLRGDSWLGRGYAPLPITLPRQHDAALSFAMLFPALFIQ